MKNRRKVEWFPRVLTLSINTSSNAIFFGVVGTSVSSFIAGICIGLMIGKVGYLGKLVLVMLFEPCSFFVFF